jgi:hypothetical protein
LELLHRELSVREIAPAVGSGARWPESRWNKDTCTRLSPWEVHRKKDLDCQIYHQGPIVLGSGGRCEGFNPRNNRGKRTRQVPKALGLLIKETCGEWSRFGENPKRSSQGVVFWHFRTWEVEGPRTICS